MRIRTMGCQPTDVSYFEAPSQLYLVKKKKKAAERGSLTPESFLWETEFLKPYDRLRMNSCKFDT